MSEMARIVAAMSTDEVSALSGRMTAPGVPPKDAREAARHMALIRQHQQRERRLVEEQAARARKRREQGAQDVQRWCAVLPHFEATRAQRDVVALWRRGLPAPVRPEVWARAIGNPAQISTEMYILCKEKARIHSEADARRLADPVAGALGITSYATAPADGDLRRSFAADLTGPTTATPYSNTDYSCCIPDDEPNAAGPSGSPRCPRAVVGSPVVSPTSRKTDNSIAIAVDLPRTIITRTGGETEPPPFTTISREATCDVPPPSEADVFYTNPSGSSPTELAALHLTNMCGNQQLLARIGSTLRAFVELRPDVGYVQGMSYLAAMLLLHIASDEGAFVALASLVSRGHMRYFYTVHHRGIAAHIAVFEAVLLKGLPSLHRHLQVVGVTPQMYVIDWWMSLFSRALPYEIVARCWDLFLLDPAYLYRISMAIFVYFEAFVHTDSPMDEIMMFLTKIQRHAIDEERFFAIVAAEDRYPPAIAAIRGMMQQHLAPLGD